MSLLKHKQFVKILQDKAKRRQRADSAQNDSNTSVFRSKRQRGYSTCKHVRFDESVKGRTFILPWMDAETLGTYASEIWYSRDNYQTFWQERIDTVRAWRAGQDIGTARGLETYESSELAAELSYQRDQHMVAVLQAQGQHGKQMHCGDTLQSTWASLQAARRAQALATADDTPRKSYPYSPASVMGYATKTVSEEEALLYIQHPPIVHAIDPEEAKRQRIIQERRASMLQTRRNSLLQERQNSMQQQQRQRESMEMLMKVQREQDFRSNHSSMQKVRLHSQQESDTNTPGRKRMSRRGSLLREHVRRCSITAKSSSSGRRLVNYDRRSSLHSNGWKRRDSVYGGNSSNNAVRMASSCYDDMRSCSFLRRDSLAGQYFDN